MFLHTLYIIIIITCADVQLRNSWWLSVYFVVVSVPSSSEDEGVEKLTSKTVEVVKTEQPVAIRETRRFSETIAIDHRQKLAEMALQFQLPQPRREKSEYIVRRESLPKGLKLEVRVYVLLLIVVINK